MSAVAALGRVALGSALGAALRVLAGAATMSASGFPWPALLLNALGCLLAGALAAWVTMLPEQAARRVQLTWITGFCGGYTSFSLVSLEGLLLWQRGEIGWLLAYLALGWPLWLAAAWAGHLAVRGCGLAQAAAIGKTGGSDRKGARGD